LRHLNPYLAAVPASAGGILFGYDLSAAVGAQMSLAEQFQLSAAQLGLAMAIALAGCALGPICLAAGMADRWGRRATLAAAAAIYAAASLGAAFSTNIASFYFFRLLAGAGLGLAMTVSPMYIAELAPSPIRGRLVAINQLAIGCAALVSIFIAYALMREMHLGNLHGAWRWMFAGAALPAAMLLLALQLMPESPRWLVLHGRMEAALCALQRLSAPPDAEFELAQIQRSLSGQSGSGSFRELFHPPLKQLLAAMSVLALLQQLTGVSPLLFYLPKLYQMAGFESPVNALWQSALTTCWSVACNGIAILCVDRWGRRPLLMAGCMLMAVGFMVLALCFAFHASGLLVLPPVFLCVGAYNFSLGPLVWLIISESFDNRIRARAMALLSTLIWLLNFIAVVTLPAATQFFERTLGTPAALFALFAAICVLGTLVIWSVIPETKEISIDVQLEMN